MSRIRSVHPGLWTDEAFMEASPSARLLLIGLWCECFDDGVFEWKPLTLKARLFPSDTVNLVDLLGELERLRFLTRFESSGRSYGAVRNFQKYQRPRKPNSSNVLPPSLLGYVQGSGTGAELVEDQFGTGAEPVRYQFGTGAELVEDQFGTEPSPRHPSACQRAGFGEFPTSSEPVPNQFRTSSPRRMEEGGGREEKSTTSTDVEASGLAAGLERLKPACGVRRPESSDLSPEDEFWEIAETLQDRGVARSRMGELGKLHDGDFRALVVIAREIQRARSPSTYLGGIIKRRKAELAEDNANASARDGSSDEPEFIRAWRRDGDRVEVYGPNRWRLNGQGIYDEHGDQVGF